MNDDVLVKVENVSKRFCRSLKKSLWYGLQDLGSELGGHRHGGGAGLPQSSADVALRNDEFWAVKDVSFDLRRGECLGLIGRNGAGKTTLLRMLNGLIKPDTGFMQTAGKVNSLIALGAGFNPILTGRENVYTNASILGLKRNEASEKIDEIIDFADIGKFIDTPVQSYSSGMQVRLGFAVATAFKPDILILDEVLAVGDASFKAKCYSRIGNIISDTAVVLVSHNENQIARLCSQCSILDQGKQIATGKPQDMIAQYLSAGTIESPRQETVNKLGAQISLKTITKTVAYGSCAQAEISSSIDLSGMNIVIQLTRNSEIVSSTAPILIQSNKVNGAEYKYSLSLGPLFLSGGNYEINFFIESLDRSNLLYQVLGCSSVSLEGYIQVSPTSILNLSFSH